MSRVTSFGPGEDRCLFVTEGSVLDQKQYTVTNKVRANRINLERRAPSARRILYRTPRSGVTPAALTCLSGASPLTLSRTCATGCGRSTCGTAPPGWETQEVYDRHISWWRACCRSTTSGNATGRGLGQALWRRRLLFGSRVHRGGPRLLPGVGEGGGLGPVPGFDSLVSFCG
jgi:hypothetical protein